MALDVLLVGPRGHGGEGVYMDTLERHPPDGVRYDISSGFHQSAAAADCILPAEVALNQLVRPRTFPDIGFRALRLRKRYDVIHAHAHPVWLRGVRGAPLIMSEGSSAAVYLADYLGWTPARVAAALAKSRRIYRTLGIHDRLVTMTGVARVYVFSEWAREVNLRWGADPEKLEVIYPGFETPPTVDRTGRDTFTFLFVGSDFERKGGYDVIEAFSRISSELPHTRLVLAGFDPGRPNPDLQTRSWVSPGRRARTMAQLADLQHARRASHVAWVAAERLRRDLFPAADAFVMPTHAEGFGFTNVEAMSFGLPVITSNAGPADEIVSNGETGLLVTSGDVDSLAEAMASLATDSGRSHRLGAEGRLAFERRFTMDRFRAELRGLYDQVLGSA